MLIGLKSIQLAAMLAVLRPDREAFNRKVQRWYSKTLNTPLADVEELPLEDVFQAYFEEQYAEMKPEDLDAERASLLLSDEDRYKQILEEEAMEAEMFETTCIIAADEAQRKLEADKAKKANISDLQHQKPGLIRAMEMPESKLASGLPKELPPAITMSFVSEEDFEAELEGFGSMVQPLKP